MRPVNKFLKYFEFFFIFFSYVRQSLVCYKAGNTQFSSKYTNQPSMNLLSYLTIISQKEPRSKYFFENLHINFIFILFVKIS